ncbi:MAG: DNA polymerase I [Parcubacteria group bacterium]|jgi:DNA polymerase-1
MTKNKHSSSAKATAGRSKTLLLLDGNAILHRAYHAIPPLSTDDGVQTNAVYGFVSTLFTVLEKFQPEYIVASFDVPGKNFRHEMFPEYKTKRKETPEDLTPQFDLVKDVVRSLGITIVEKEGFEADDVIGTISTHITDDVDVVIVTGDKDTLQLVNDHVRVFTMSRGIHDMVLYDRELVKDKMGVEVEQIVDYKGLRGDPSDNIPGVKGIGEKTAVELLTTYHDLDHIYSHIDEIKDSVRKKLEANKEKAYLSRTLGIIRTDVPVALINLGAAQTADITFDRARTMFHKLGFNSLIRRFPTSAGAQEKTQSQKNAMHITVVAERDVAMVCKKCASSVVSVAIDASQTQMYGMALFVGDQVQYMPYTQKTAEILGHFMKDSTIKKVIYDVKSFLHDVERWHMTVDGVVDDVLLQAYVVQQNKKFDLDALAFDVLGVLSEGKKTSNQMALMLRDHDEQVNVVCTRAYHTAMLHAHFCAKIDEIIKTQKEKANIKTVLDTIEMPLIDVLFHMEKRGIGIDKGRLKEIATVINAEIDTLTQTIYGHAGEVFNINSTQQLRVILFDKLQISTQNIKKTKTGFSTASDELGKIRDVHPIVAEIERYRELFKLKTTYVDVLPTLTDAEDRIHTTFNQAVATTGRLSSSDPNLQNIPIRTEDGRRLREGFKAKKGYTFVSVDYSQIDLRCVAHVSGDPALIKAFNDGMDIHTYTAAQVLGIAPEEITKEQRRSAKELNFGLIYGMGQFGFARAAGIDTKEAKKFITAYFEKFAGVKVYIENTKKQAMKSGYVETLFGRRRYVKEIQSKNFQLHAAGERAAINMPIQGLAADIMKLAMIAADRHIAKKYGTDDAYAVLQIHDEIIFEVCEELAGEFAEQMTHVMENVCTLKVPLAVDVSQGERWSEL